MPQLVRRRFFVLTILALLTPSTLRAAPATAPLITANHSDCAIFCDPTDPLSLRSATRLADTLAEQTGTRPPILTPADLSPASPYPTLIILDGAADQPLLAKLDAKAEVPPDRPDAYALAVARHADHWVVSLAGRTPAGAKYAAYRLAEEFTLAGHDASIPPLDLHASPFFPTRSVSLFNIWRVPVDTIRQCNLESWPAEKIQRNVDTYDAFGFNAVETHDRFHEDFLKAVYGLTRPEWRDKVYALCDRAHADGMTVFLRLWGNSVALPVKQLKGGFTPFGFINLTPDLPEEKKRWDTEIRDYASKTYAAHIDHLIGHWADAGGVHDGSHATVKDSMLLHNELVAAFRAINPNLQSSFNLWGMANPKGHRGWPGYEDHNSIANAGILPADVAIAQTTRSHSHAYSEKVTADILASGHPAAVWTWRRADTEVRLGDAGIRIRVHDPIGNYFNALPDSARQLAWHNIERNHHGLATDVNFYVAGKLMWDPHANVDALLSKYCQLVFGPANAAAVAEAFNTIEVSRHIERYVSDEVLAHPAAGARRARAALDALQQIKLPADHHARLPSVTSPQEMLDQLRGTLAAIAENAEIIATRLPELDALIKSGKSDEARAIASELSAKSTAWFGSITAGVEGAWLKEAVAARNPSDNTTSRPLDPDDADKPKTIEGFTTHNVASLSPIESTGGVQLSAANAPNGGKEFATAITELKPAADPAAITEFHVRLKSPGAGPSRNGGLAFGPTDAPRDLTRCILYLGGHFIRITGAGVEDSGKVDVPNLDANAQQDCTIRVDPARHLVTMTVNKTTATAKMTGNPRPLHHYGYVTERATTTFGPVEVLHPVSPLPAAQP